MPNSSRTLGTVTGVDGLDAGVELTLRGRCPTDRSVSPTEWCGFACRRTVRGVTGSRLGRACCSRKCRTAATGQRSRRLRRGRYGIAGGGDRPCHRRRPPRHRAATSRSPQTPVPGRSSWEADRVRVRKRRHPHERHSGFGERTTLDQTAGTKTFWNVNARQYGPTTDEMYCSIPVFVAHRSGVTYGFFLNTPGWAQIRAAPNSDTWIAEAAGVELDYVVAHGPDPAQVLERLTALIGRIELPPRWAIGYHQSHWGYDSAATLRGVAGEFARRQLPCDSVHLDISYMDGHRVFTWDPERFPDPASLVADLERHGMRCVAIVDPRCEARAGERRVRRRRRPRRIHPRRDGRVGLRLRVAGALRVSRLPAPRRPTVVGGPPQRPHRCWCGRHLERHERTGDLRRTGRGRDRRLGRRDARRRRAGSAGPSRPARRRAQPVRAVDGPGCGRGDGRGCDPTVGRSPSAAQDSPGSSATPRSGLATTRRRGSTSGCPCRCCATSACRASRSSAPTSAASGATRPRSCSPAGSRRACCTR